MNVIGMLLPLLAVIAFAMIVFVAWPSSTRVERRVQLLVLAAMLVCYGFLITGNL